MKSFPGLAEFGSWFLARQTRRSMYGGILPGD
jgi:hypothetical protein